MPTTRLGRRVLSASLDVLTGLSCVAYWVGIWSLLDAFHVHKVPTGVAALGIIFMLAFTSVDRWLEMRSKTWSPMAEAVATWMWTCWLTFLSILIWRVTWFCVDEQVFAPEGGIKPDVKVLGTPGWAKMGHPRALMLATIGTFVLVASGRFRSTSGAAPVGIVSDLHVAGGGFASPAFSGGKMKDIVKDFALTLPAVFVWAGVWTTLDNLNVPPLRSAVFCIAVVMLCAISEIDSRLRGAFDGLTTFTQNIGDFAFTAILGLLVIGVWRGVWEAIDRKLTLAQHPHLAAMTALLGALGLTVMQRHRSAIFPPIDFTVDEGDHFSKVGNTDPEYCSAD